VHAQIWTAADHGTRYEALRLPLWFWETGLAVVERCGYAIGVHSAHFGFRFHLGVYAMFDGEARMILELGWDHVPDLEGSHKASYDGRFDIIWAFCRQFWDHAWNHRRLQEMGQPAIGDRESYRY
jgi:hypothetical protein